VIQVNVYLHTRSGEPRQYVKDGRSARQASPYSLDYFTSAEVAAVFTQMSAVFSSSWNDYTRLHILLTGTSRLWCWVYCCPHSQIAQLIRPHPCRCERNGLWPVQKRFYRDRMRRGASKHDCRIL